MVGVLSFVKPAICAASFVIIFPVLPFQPGTLSSIEVILTLTVLAPVSESLKSNTILSLPLAPLLPAASLKYASASYTRPLAFAPNAKGLPAFGWPCSY